MVLCSDPVGTNLLKSPWKKTHSSWNVYIKLHVTPQHCLPTHARSIYSDTQFPAPTQLLDRMHITIHLLPSTFTHFKCFRFGYLEFFKLQWELKKKKPRKKQILSHLKEKRCFISKSIVRMLKTAYVPTVLAATHKTSQTTRSLYDQEVNHWAHKKEVTQTEIHKGQHEWDRISSYSSFYMARLLH